MLAPRGEPSGAVALLTSPSTTTLSRPMITILRCSLVGLLLCAGCESPEYVPERSLPARTMPDDSTQPAVERHDGQTPYSGDPADSARDDSAGGGGGAPAVRVTDGATAGPVAEFCETIVRHARNGENVACLPLVTREPRSAGPWVSEYGVDLADEIAERLSFLAFEGSVLETATVGVRLTRAEISRPAVATLEDATELGDVLGVELIVFGTIRRDNNVGRSGRDVLTIDLNCWNASTDEVMARAKFEVPSDVHENSRIWRLAQQESLWSPGRRQL